MRPSKPAAQPRAPPARHCTGSVGRCACGATGCRAQFAGRLVLHQYGLWHPVRKRSSHFRSRARIQALTPKQGGRLNTANPTSPPSHCFSPSPSMEAFVCFFLLEFLERVLGLGSPVVITLPLIDSPKRIVWLGIGGIVIDSEVEFLDYFFCPSALSPTGGPSENAPWGNASRKVMTPRSPSERRRSSPA